MGVIVSPWLHFDFVDTPSGFAPCRFLNPIEIVTAHCPDDVLPAIRRVQDTVDHGSYAAGFVSYEAAPAFDAAMATPPVSDLPLVWFGIYEGPFPIDDEVPSEGPFQVGDWCCPVNDARFQSEIGSIRDSIVAGDVYQVNHTVRLRAPFQGDAFAWYRSLSAAQQGAYSAYLDLGRFQILSVSPELFFSVQPIQTGVISSLSSTLINSHSFPFSKITTRPMKGTHRRGRWKSEDDEFCDRLASSEKDRAENLMIVDLLRNDLGRIAQTGSVQVEQLFHVERYPTLLQMTSSVSARLRDEVGLTEILTALFPCGSVTGAPKIAAMKRIAELEPEPRKVYCGTIGYIEPGGRAIFNVAIRTATIDRETNVAEYGVGSGITWDSQPEGESAENRLKTAILVETRPTPDLFETLRLENGTIERRERHIRRMAESSRYFGIRCDERLLNYRLDEIQADNQCSTWRVRLRVTATGVVSVEREPLADLGQESMAFSLCMEPIDRNDRFLFHKVADRSTYTVRKSVRPDVYDVLLQNREGELTEFTTGNLVVEIDGQRVTPPLGCGLLPGVMRGALLDACEIVERIPVAEDLRRADAVWLINSLRGWVPMRLVD